MSSVETCEDNPEATGEERPTGKKEADDSP